MIALAKPQPPVGAVQAVAWPLPSHQARLRPAVERGQDGRSVSQRQLMILLGIDVRVVKGMIEAATCEHMIVPDLGNLAFAGEAVNRRDLARGVRGIEFIHRQQFPDELTTDHIVIAGVRRPEIGWQDAS